MYHIQDIAKICGVSTQTIRYYEKIGLMPKPKRESSSDYRVYNEEDIAQLLNIVQLRSLGFGISEIKKYTNNTFTKDEKIHSLRNIIDLCNMQIALIQGVLDKKETPELIVRNRYDFYGITKTLEIGPPVEITNHFTEMINYAKKQHIILQNPVCYMVKHDFSTGKMTLILPVKPCEDQLILYYPKKKIMSAYFHCSIENFGDSIAYVREESARLGYKLEAAPTERYLFPINPINNHCVVEFQFEII